MQDTRKAPATTEDAKPWASLSWPNRITLFRLLLIAPFIVLILNQREWGDSARYGALAVFVIMAVSDFLDGMLARRLNRKTRFGAILDPLADKALIISAVVLLSLPDSAVPAAPISNWIVVVIVGKDLWVIVGFIVIYLVTDRFRIHPTRAGKAATLGQLIMVLSVLIAPELNRIVGGLGSMLARLLGWLVTVVSVLAAVSYTRLGLSFVAEEQKPLESPPNKEPREP